jgi:hypothetical protein
MDAIEENKQEQHELQGKPVNLQEQHGYVSSTERELVYELFSESWCDVIDNCADTV